jgi:hypothetical protein
MNYITLDTRGQISRKEVKLATSFKYYGSLFIVHETYTSLLAPLTEQVFTCTDADTGMLVSTGATTKDAKENAIKKLHSVSMQRYLKNKVKGLKMQIDQLLEANNVT